MKKLFSVVSSVLAIGLSLSGCGTTGMSDSNTSADKSTSIISERNNTLPSNDFDVPADAGTGGNNQNINSSTIVKEENLRKVIVTASLEIETKEFERAVDFITKYASLDGAYIQESEVSGGDNLSGEYRENRIGHFVLRIPTTKIDTFMDKVDEIGLVVSENKSGQDITSNYYDTEARLKSQLIQEERILNLLKKSEKLTDILELEKYLADLRYKIENLTGTLKMYDNLVELSTITVNIREVQVIKEIKEKPIRYIDKIAETFKGSVGNLFKALKVVGLVIVALIPFITLLGLPTVIIIAVSRFIKKVKKS